MNATYLQGVEKTEVSFKSTPCIILERDVHWLKIKLTDAYDGVTEINIEAAEIATFLQIRDELVKQLRNL